MSTITNGASYRCVWWWTQHFEDDKENVRTEIVASKGLASENIHDLLCEIQTIAEAARPDDARWKNFMSVFDISPHPGKQPTEQQWDRMRQIIEEERGLKGEVYFMVEQEKADGRIHRHLIELRIDLETGRAIPDNWDAPKMHAASRRICEEFGWERTPRPFDKDREGPRPERAPKRWESYRAMQSGLKIEDIEAEVTALRQESDNGQAFKAALEEHGYILAQGDKIIAGERALMIIDIAGDEHSLARRLGMKSKELNEFMRDVDRSALPDIRQAQAMQQERKIAALEADRDCYNQKWEQAVMDAAIEKEKTAREFDETRAGQQPGPAPGLIRMYRGIGNNIGAAEPGEALFFSTDPSRAATFGKIHYVDITADEMAKFEPTVSDRTLEQSVIRPHSINDWRTADPAIIARLKPLEIERVAPAEPARQETRAGGINWEEARAASRGESRILDAGKRAMFDDWTKEGDVQPNAKAFAEALEQKGIAFAVVTPEESYRSHRERAFAQAVGRKSDYFAPGEIVAVTEPGLLYHRAGEWMPPPRVHKLDQDQAGQYLKFLSIDKAKLKGIDATKFMLDASAQARAAYWQDIRLDNARRQNHRAPERSSKDRTAEKIADTGASVALGTIGKGLDIVGSIFESLLSPKLTPEQKREGELTRQDRAADAEQALDFSRFTADAAQEQRDRQEQQAARDRQRENERER
jgi:hypothetical protein